MPPKTQNKKEELPQREANLFKSVVRFLDSKSFQKAIRAADQILKRFPDHADTLASKGLVTTRMKKKDEGLALIKRALALDIKNSTAWHCYGLYYRDEHKYEDAIKCYYKAFQYDSSKTEILKDLSLLQIQKRILDGFEETRRKILLIKPGNRNNWLAYAIGCHLNCHYDKCLHILDSYLKTVEPSDSKVQSSSTEPYEDSELRMYKIQVMIEAGLHEKALTYLNDVDNYVVDRLGWREQKASLLLHLNRKTEAATEYRDLIDINPDNYAYHSGLQAAMNFAPTSPISSSFSSTSSSSSIVSPSLASDQVKGLVSLYEELAKKYPSASSVHRIPLDFLSDNAFVERADQYLKKALRKGIPSLFQDMRPLYKDPKKVKAIEQLILSYLINLRKDLRFSGKEESTESPSVLMWTLAYAGCHYDQTGDFANGLKMTDEAIMHTPTNLDLYVLKARLYKHAGDFDSAFFWMDTARKMDTADRYLNTKTVRYAFRANKIEQAQKIVSLFLRSSEGQEPTLKTMFDMQAAWYAIVSGKAHARVGQYGMALKHLTAVEKFYDAMVEDQFDFHTYCLRKMTLRAYVSMLRWEDTIRSHSFYFKAARATVKKYIEVHENRLKAKLKQQEQTEAEAKLSPEQLKAQKKKEKRDTNKANKKAMALKAEEDAKKKQEQSGKKNAPKAKEEEKDDDPNGEKLVNVENPLDAASLYMHNLEMFSPNSLDTHLIGIELYTRKQKPLLRLRALKRAIALGHAEHPDVFTALASFSLLLEKNLSSFNHAVKQVVEPEMKSGVLASFATAGLPSLAKSFAEKHRTSQAHVLAAARVLLMVDPQKYKKDVLTMLETPTTNATWRECVQVHQLLLEQKETTAASAFFSKCSILFPFTPAFLSPQKLSAIQLMLTTEYDPKKASDYRSSNIFTTSSSSSSSDKA
eukprot:TRINITY_DN4952_c0_g1_i1.p1 TRINITY_DN4952_c0_g1~~TRINITY_DN4952_c0_g1_i1.p1  ORF type:complete len:923 (+),score=218.40 TRINITY_DN4952_c0_g1_i1:51-2819(+)